MHIRLTLAAMVLFAATARAAESPPSYAQVHALFAKHCLNCHGAKEPEGNLVLESYDSLMKGGDTGPAIVKGNAGESLLIKLIERKQKPFMPPPKKAQKLPETDIALIRAWIDAGAKPPGPGEVPVAGATSRPVEIPHIAPKSPARTPIQALAVDAASGIVAIGMPGVVELRTIDGMALIRKLEGHRGNVNALAFSADGKQLAAGAGEIGVSGEIRVWDVANGKLLATLSGHKDAVYAVAISPDGKTLASGSFDQEILLWNIAEQKSIRTLHGHNGAICGLSFRKDGKVLASASADRTMKLWDPATGKRLDTRSEPLKEQNAVAFSPDGQRVAAAGVDNRIRIWKVTPTAAENTNPLLIAQFAHEGAILRLAWSSDGKSIATSADDRTVKVWDVPATGDELKQRITLPQQPDWPTGLAFAEKDQKVIVGRLDGTLGVYDARTGQVVRSENDDLPHIAEQEPNNSAAEAQSISLPAVAHGAFAARGDADCFAFDATKGQTIILDIGAQRIGSKAAVKLAVLDSSGKTLIAATHFDNDADPLIAFTAPADGRYVAQVAEQMDAASPEHKYRLTIGSFPFVTGAFPLEVRANETSKVRLIGFNLPKESTAIVKTGAAGEVAVPLGHAFRSRRPISVMVSVAEQHVEAEPNDMPAQATQFAVPFGVSGVLAAPRDGVSDVDLYRFVAKKGQTYVLETAAQRRGSPADTKIEVLHADGKPVERVKLRAVRDSYITFRPIDGNNAGARLQNWEEMQLNQFVYLNGEVVKLFRAPQGPDSEYLFYPAPGGGKRQTYFDTSATSHALDERAYIVEPHKPSDDFPANGLPTFTLNYANDDAADRTLGSDSRLLFTAPADGEYLARVTDVRGFGGERFVYHLSVRPAAPDFRVAIDLGKDPTIPGGSGKSFTVKVDRIDGFDGSVRVEFTGVPEGFRISSPLVVEAGHLEAKGTLFAPSAEANAPATKPAPPPLVAKATAQIGMEERCAAPIDLGTPKVSGKPMIEVVLAASHEASAKASTSPQAQEIVVKPGQMASALLRIDRGNFKERVSFDVENLPHGVIVADIGLNGVLIPEGQSERQIFISCAPWVADQTRVCHARAREAGNPTSAPIMLRVQK
jgi:WD40 repeat protein